MEGNGLHGVNRREWTTIDILKIVGTTTKDIHPILLWTETRKKRDDT